MSKYKISWEVEDGYLGSTRIHHTDIDTEELMDDSEWNELTDSEKKEHINCIVEVDFKNKVSFNILGYML